MKIIFEDGIEYQLPDLSYEQYIKSDLYTKGSSDVEYNKYLRSKGMKELYDFNKDGVEDMTLVYEHEGRTIMFKAIYDSNRLEG